MDRLEYKLQRSVKMYLDGRKDCWYLETHGEPKGTPDLIVCCQGQFFAFELKREYMKGYGTTDTQEYTLADIRRAGGKTYVVRSVLEVKGHLPPKE